VTTSDLALDMDRTRENLSAIIASHCEQREGEASTRVASCPTLRDQWNYEQQAIFAQPDALFVDAKDFES